MLPPEPAVLLARQGFADAQAAMVGVKSVLGFYSCGWYGTDTNDERGSFGIVNTTGPLVQLIGDFVCVEVGRFQVYVYIIGSESTLLTDMAVTRRSFQAIQLLAVDPVQAKVSVVS